jgi:hypothetical protein
VTGSGSHLVFTKAEADPVIIPKLGGEIHLRPALDLPWRRLDYPLQR